MPPSAHRPRSSSSQLITVPLQRSLFLKVIYSYLSVTLILTLVLGARVSEVAKKLGVMWKEADAKTKEKYQVGIFTIFRTRNQEDQPLKTVFRARQKRTRPSTPKKWKLTETVKALPLTIASECHVLILLPDFFTLSVLPSFLIHVALLVRTPNMSKIIPN